MFLKCLETGSTLHYSFITQDNTVVDGTELDWLYSADFGIWEKSLVENYKVTKQLFDATNGGRIVNHKKLDNGVTCTTYENGIKVYVNYTDADYYFDGIKISANGYFILTAGGSENE